MADSRAQVLRDFAILTIINVFGLFYFYLSVIHFLVFHFPSSPGGILDSLSVLAFCAGVILVWSYFSLDLGDHDSFGNFAFRTKPYFQLGYLSVFTVVAVGILVDFVNWEPSICAARYRFPYSCVSLGLLSLTLIPTIHALAGTFQSPPASAVHFGRIAIWNPFGAVFYLLRPLERFGVVTGWRPSLYVVQLVLAYSAVTYSRIILRVVLQSAS
ncbi:uncharacterized protein N7446_007908 [Penicillium canescens]|uniref:Uncharacterized protein n=1 Tax=Penicillium canescens TaxID=5083 RepID=A0AAD6NE08_PENCN|nr:uncharacterized protein N7446_007908 [Penicillium canescens]KAJ6057009.1 hypothetical protein N7460_000283 [Penicillium canescens]KAJ6058325.1 hypothetical protein N7446_007908 [Penicillium canescens]